MPRLTYSPRLQQIIAKVLDGLNQKQPVLSDGSGRRLKFRLASRTELKVTIQSDR